VVLMIAGVFSVAGGIADLDWFMQSRRARAVIGLMGRRGARVFYLVLGLLIGGIGLYTLVDG
jgi:hypothetical protein